MSVIEASPTTNTRLEALFTDVMEALLGIIKTHQVTWDEYRAATEWLTEAGNQGYEIPLLLDVLLSPTVDDVNFGDQGGTESNVEGPFHVPDAPMLERPHVLPRREDEPGEILMFSGTVRSTDGSALAGAVLDIWQANGAGEYSHFHPGVPDYNLRGRLRTDDEGRFQFETVFPSPYEIPNRGATGKLLAALGRHCFRPGHIHFKLGHERARSLTTQIYFEGDPWIDSDVVGAVKAPLVTKIAWEDGDRDRRATCSYDFSLRPN
ncbi:MAG: catechol 1,2-dioxygenase [Actinomycetota bacterium]|nr:catechol 1,2-dioxygenase [Actinomycetota bacterium]